MKAVVSERGVRDSCSVELSGVRGVGSGVSGASSHVTVKTRDSESACWYGDLQSCSVVLEISGTWRGICGFERA